MKVRVSVTEEEIEDGTPGNAEYCPVALAVRRALEAYQGYERAHVVVGMYDLSVDHRQYQLPPQARAFARAFDAGRRGEPFEFELEVL